MININNAHDQFAAEPGSPFPEQPLRLNRPNAPPPEENRPDGDPERINRVPA